MSIYTTFGGHVPPVTVADEAIAARAILPHNSGRLREGARITTEFLGDRVRKTFDEGARPGRVRAMFLREVAALRRFADLGAGFVPRLIDLDESKLWHETELVGGAQTLNAWLSAPPSNGLDTVITHLIAIDGFLYRHRIDYRASSPQHILINEDHETTITGFAHTRLEHRFDDILYDRLFQVLLPGRGDGGAAHVFLAALATRRDEVHHFLARRLRSVILRPLGVGGGGGVSRR